MKNNMRKKIEKFLDKKIEIASAMWLLVFLYVITIMFTFKKNDYYYIDKNNNSGHSNKCYYNGNTRHIECLVPIEVQQYYKN